MSTQSTFTLSFTATQEEVAEWGRSLHPAGLARVEWRNGRAMFHASTKRRDSVWEFLHGIGLEARDPKGVYETEDGFVHTWGE